MPDARSERPSKPLPHVVYRPPYLVDQPTRSQSARDVWADVERLMELAITPDRGTSTELTLTMRRWTEESMRSQPMNWLGEWPAECSVADFDEAVRLGIERFGTPRRSATGDVAKRDGLLEQRMWTVPMGRSDEVLDLMEHVPSCTGGAIAPVHASFFSLFRLRDLHTGKLLPRQGKQHHVQQSSLRLRMQRHSVANMLLALPFAEPDAQAADYVVALQEYLPIWLDPRYFDHVTVASDGASYPRRRLAPDWVGVGGAGAVRLDASRSGITPTGELPSDAEMAAEDPERDDAPINANYLTIETALREHSTAAVVIRGSQSGSKRLVRLAAQRLGMPLHVVDSAISPDTPGELGDELRAVIDLLSDRPAVIVIHLSFFSDEETKALVRAQSPTRTIAGVALPLAVRLVVTETGAPGEEASAVAARLHAVQTEGFATTLQRKFLERQSWRAVNRDMVIELVPLDAAAHRRLGAP